MKVIISKSELQSGISAVQKAINPRANMPILECILIQAGDSLKLTGNDLENGIAIEYTCDAEIVEGGSIAVNSKLFGSIVSKLDGEITLEVKSSKMSIEADSSRFEIATIDPSGYPSIQEVKGLDVEINLNKFQSMVSKVSFAAGSFSKAPQLEGIFIQSKNEELNVVGSDGYRLAIRKCKTTIKDFSALVPAKTLNDIVKIIDGDIIKLTISLNQAQFRTDKCRITSRLIDGSYLDYKGFITRIEPTVFVTAKTKDIIRAVERANLVIDDAQKPVVFNTGDNLIIYSDSISGTAKEEVKAGIDGKLKIGLNPKHVLEALRAIEDEEITMCFAGDKAPCVIKSENYDYMLLPVIVRGV